MNEIKFELTEEQREAILKLADAVKIVIEDAYEAIVQFTKEVTETFNAYVMSLQPKTRYKFLKRLGIENYNPFFKRYGVVRCRNRC